MRAVDIVIGLGWIVFWLYWFIVAASAKRGQNRSGPFASVRIVIVLVVLLLVRMGSLRGHFGTNDNPLLGGIGLALFVVGIVEAVWARAYLGHNWGMPMSQKDDPELVTTGPYHYVRHPIYSGLILAMIGTTLAVSTYAIIAVVAMGSYFVYSATVEERTMQSLFPSIYSRYQRSTKMLVPFVL